MAVAWIGARSATAAGFAWEARGRFGRAWLCCASQLPGRLEFAGVVCRDRVGERRLGPGTAWRWLGRRLIGRRRGGWLARWRTGSRRVLRRQRFLQCEDRVVWAYWFARRC